MMMVRTVTVMNRHVVSVWCIAHGLGKDHVVWSGSVEAHTYEASELLDATAEALTQLRRADDRGEIETLTSQCLN